MGLFLMAVGSVLAALGPWMAKLVYAVEVIFGVGLVIFVHELGHFLAAKVCGVKVEKFYVGFDLPPWRLLGIPMPGRLFSFQRGETEYGIGIIPLGGYVKMLGQDDNPANAEKEAERIRVKPEDGESEGASEPVLDPRSYPAKSVPQRMLIISAGIIMNLIFAVVFAAVAYRAGVEYSPAVISGATPGDPAWLAGLEPGDQILQVGRSGTPNEHLRYDKDMRVKILTAGMGLETPKEIDVLVRSEGSDGEPRWLKLRPTRRGDDPDAPPAIGVLPVFSTTVGPVPDWLPAGKTDPPLQPGDRIVAINGHEFDRSKANEKGEIPAFELERALGEYLDEPVQLRVERPGADGAVAETFDVTLEPNPRKWLGFTVQMGPITAVRPGSPAEQAGFQVGDVIREVDGEPVGNPTTLPQRLAVRESSEPITFTVERNKGEQKESVTFQVDGPVRLNPAAGIPGAYLGIDPIGIAYGVVPEVAHVDPDSAAEKEGVKPGDRLIGYQLIPQTPEIHQQLLESPWFGKNYNRDHEISSELHAWLTVDATVQVCPPGVDVLLTLLREGEEIEVRLPVVTEPGVYDEDRGLNLQPLHRVHRATSFAEAVQLGLRETKERLAEVWTVLGMLFTGRVSVSDLGGPIRIAAVAGWEASISLPRLLMFLTFFSANLALLNALPIPVLDGGHLMFLAWEGIFRRPVPERVQLRLTLAGFAFLLMLMLFVFAMDISWLWEFLL